MDSIINRVSQSGLVELNLEDYFPAVERVQFDLIDCLWQGLVLKENDFREFIKGNNWEKYRNKAVAVHCSAEAIVPTWAYMLLTAALEPFAKKITFGNLNALENILWTESISTITIEDFRDARVVIKGCSDKMVIPEIAYLEITRLLRPVVKSIMYGEPCSTVPIYKRRDI